MDMKNASRKHLPIALVTGDARRDLAVLVGEQYEGVVLCGTLREALGAAEERGLLGVMLLSDGYPESLTAVDDGDARALRESGLRYYIEYPAPSEALGVTGYGEAIPMGYERAVVTQPEAFGLEMHSLLYIHGAMCLQKADVSRALLVRARVAGYDTADFGLSDCTPSCLLERTAEGDGLVAATRLSAFRMARYAPHGRLSAILTGILSFLVGRPVEALSWEDAVRPHYRPEEPLPPAAYREAVRLNSEWYLHSGILVRADGSGGIYEGFSSGDRFDPHGRQEMRRLLRADCNGESIGALALGARLLGCRDYGEVAHRAMRWLLTESLLSCGERADPASAEYGLLSWHNGAYDQYYGDDNAKAIIGLLLGAAALGTGEFDRRILAAILANLRTTGPQGFRGARLVAKELRERGWRHFYTTGRLHFSAHFEALPLATYLLAYDRCGYAPLYERAFLGITRMMEAYENTMSPEVTDRGVQWRWANGMQQERAKMILPLAFLVRIAPTERHILWLDRMVEDLMAYRDAATGALADAFGNPTEGHGLYGPFTANSHYGCHESPVIQKNGDPCSDSLYTASFAMLTLTEAEGAAAAAGRGELAARYRDYARSLCDYHVRIQQVSRDIPEYHGVWFRGFDFQKWETYGSDGDAGWGVFCVETGWSQAWISSALSLREMGTTLWDYTRTTTMAEHIDGLVREMLS